MSGAAGGAGAVSPRSTAILLGVLLLGLWVRSAGIGTPLTGIRETQSAMIARNILRDGPAGVFHPRVDYGGDGPGWFALEFPLTGALGALAWRLVPSLGDSALRVPSILFYVLGTLALFDLARRRAGVRTALFAAAFLAVLPLPAEMGASAMPDETGLALSTTALALLDRHLKGGRAAAAAGAVACAALALLAKSTYFFLAIPMGALIAAERGIREIVRPKWILLGALAALPLVAWLLHANALNEASELWIGRTVADTNATYAVQRGRLTYWFSPDWYARLGGRLLALLGLAATVVTAAGLLLALRAGPARALVLAWAAAIVVYCLVLPHHLHTHHYYLLPFAPLAALLCGFAIDAVHRNVRSPVLATLLGLTVLLSVAVEGVPAARASLRAYRADPVHFGEAARRIVPEGRLLVVSALVVKSFDGALLYQADRKGWKFTARTIDDADPDDLRALAADRRRRGVLAQGRRLVPPAVSEREALTPARIEELRARGAEFFGYAGPPSEWAREEADLARHLLARYPAVGIAERHLFVDLRILLDPSLAAPPPAPVSSGGFSLAGVLPSPDPARFPGQVLVWRREGGTPPHPPGGAAFMGLVPASAFEPGGMALEWAGREDAR